MATGNHETLRVEEIPMITRHKSDGIVARKTRCRPYTVTSCAPGDLTGPEMDRCLAIIASGEAVDPKSAKGELPRARALAVVRSKDQIVGVGAIKRVRTTYFN